MFTLNVFNFYTNWDIHFVCIFMSKQLELLELSENIHIASLFFFNKKNKNSTGFVVTSHIILTEWNILNVVMASILSKSTMTQGSFFWLKSFCWETTNIFRSSSISRLSLTLLTSSSSTTSLLLIAWNRSCILRSPGNIEKKEKLLFGS